MPYRVLSLDGGGMRGVFTARVLERLEAAAPGFLAGVDLFAGTSTGALLALGLAQGLAPATLLRFFAEQGPRIFADPWREYPRWEGALLRARYHDARRHEALTAVFGTARLGDLPRPVLVAAFDLDDADLAGRDRAKPASWKPKFFHNYLGDEGTDAHELVVDVAMRSSAAPTFFPTWQGFVDGGVIANNPGVAALAQALDPATGGQRIEDVVMLSVGTGRNPRRVAGDRHDWGLAGWAPHLVDMLIEGAMDTARYACERLLPGRYRRVDLWLPEPVGLDDVAAVPSLLAAADGVPLDEPAGWLARTGWTAR